MNGQDLFALDNSVAVVTGGYGLLGQEFALALAQKGARVALVDLPRANLKPKPELADLIEKDRVRPFSGDVTQRADLERLLSEIENAFGAPTVLVNNAAIDSPPNAPASENGPFETYPEASLDRVMDVNIKGVFLSCQVFGGAMARRGRGSIINIGSIYGLVSPQQDIYEYRRKSGEEWYKPAAYSVTKAAVTNLTRYLATYWAKKGVRVNTLCPSGIENNQDAEFLKEYLPRIPIGRMAKSHEMSGALVFLASQASSYMTGSTLVVDGGWTAW